MCGPVTFQEEGLKGVFQEGLIPPFLHAGEEEDGDEDDEAEGATGKRAAEDDEVGKAPGCLEPPVSSEGWRGASVVPGARLSYGAGTPACVLGCLSKGVAQFSLYTGLVSGGVSSGCAELLALVGESHSAQGLLSWLRTGILHKESTLVFPCPCGEGGT